MRGRMPRAIVVPTFAPTTATITVTGTGNSLNIYLIMPDGTKVSSAGTYEIEIGSAISCYMDSSGSASAVSVNDVKVAGNGTYSYVVTKNATINLLISGKQHYIQITEEG